MVDTQLQAIESIPARKSSSSITRWLVFLAAISGFLSVGIGAMASHSLPKRLAVQGFDETTISKKLDQCDIGSKYQMAHSIALLALGLSGFANHSKLAQIASSLMLLGTLFFSGGLYSLVFADEIIHWSIVPIGGSLLMLGWLSLALASLFVKQ
jgi:uncharacterized membrane protein YgdD (TMEM256/DUF423 family)